eukprot:1243458-Prorocentrum_lima.AAC.1
MEPRIEVELERRMIALQAQAQLQFDQTTELQIAAQQELTSELRQKNQMLDGIKEQCEEHGALAKN